MTERQPYTMRQLTKQLCVSSRTIRYYEDEGLIRPSRRGVTRLYSERDRALLVIILRGRRLGYGVAEMRDMAQMYDFKEGNRAEMLVAQRTFESRVQELEEKRSDLEQGISQLHGCIAEIDARLDEKPRVV